MQIIAIHSIKKHQELQLAGEQLLRVEKMHGKKRLHRFIYRKTPKLIEILNNKETVWDVIENANSNK